MVTSVAVCQGHGNDANGGGKAMENSSQNRYFEAAQYVNLFCRFRSVSAYCAHMSG
jgi:hypothetical protein